MDIQEQLQKINTEVVDLFVLKDNYQISPRNREQSVASKSQTITTTLASILDKESNLNISQKAFCYYLQGKTLNVSTKYDKTAEQLLSKAVISSEEYT
jgi:hypothetical protein